MVAEDKDYQRIIGILRRSGPGIADPDILTERIMQRIASGKQKNRITAFIWEFLFGWVDNRWIRLPLITASAAVIMLIGYQQIVLLKKINSLTERTIIDRQPAKEPVRGYIPAGIRNYMILGIKPEVNDVNISEKQIEELIRSVNDLKERYRDLFEAIEKDPELRRYIDNRIKKTGENSSKM